MRAALILLFAACDRDPYQPLEPVQARVEVKDILNDQPRMLDLLFVVDDSPAMATIVDNLALNAPNFANVLSTWPGGLPDLRVAAITADPADGGAFRSVGNVPWLEARTYPDGRRSLNVPGTVGDAFVTLLGAGSSGSAVAQPLAMAEKALFAEPTFLRDDAPLATLFITAQDDHSPSTIADDVAWFRSAKPDPNDVFIALIDAAGCDALELPTRLSDFAMQFPNRNSATTICQHDLSDGIDFYVGPFDPIIYDSCFESQIDPDACVVSDRDDKRNIDVPVPVCDGSLRFPCFELVVDPQNCALAPTQRKLSVKRRDWAPKGSHLHAECAVID